MQFQREHYARYTSPDSLSAYHAPSGYLSPPYSASRTSASENTFMSPMTGLGITQSHTFPIQQEQHDFYTTRSGHAKMSAIAHRHFSSPNILSPPQTVPLPNYTQSSENPSYYETSRNDHLPRHHSPSILVRMPHQHEWEIPNYAEHTISPSIEGGPEPGHFRYRPAPTQDNKWVVGPHEVVYTTSSGPSNITAWDSDGFHQHAYHEQYAIHPSSMSFSVHDSRLAALSTPPASHDGTPVQEQDTHPSNTLPGCTRPLEVEDIHQDTSSSSMTSSESISTTRSRTRSRDTISRRPLERLAPLGRRHKVSVARSLLCCTQCSKTFTKQVRLTEHENSHIKNGSAAICPEPKCNKVYGRHADLARHQRSKHRGHSFPCRFCSKEFNRSDITRRHEEQSCRQRRAERVSTTTVQQPSIRPR